MATSSINQKALAAHLGLSQSFISDIIRRRKRCPAKRARAFEAACLELFGVKVPAHEWVMNIESEYPIFKSPSGAGGRNA